MDKSANHRVLPTRSAAFDASVSSFLYLFARLSVSSGHWIGKMSFLSPFVDLFLHCSGAFALWVPGARVLDLC